ncbi:MAG: NAD-dependent deacylase [Alphaproteobacteria bacterium]|nr:NAD-dependent deacylase [Alphaproteobacteria bacterium]MBM3641628.1 NAD-dependent deacylase [Alphaproteobacteria bacterium]
MNVFVLTGAGISAESGLGVFRGPGAALWKRYDPMQLATPEAFARDPALVHDFYNARRNNLIAASPNAAHVALARLEAGLAQRGDDLTLVTQNIDDLHERAGSTGVIHMHGELLKARCASCGAVHDCRDDLSTSSPCDCAGALRPHVVWFGEAPLYMDEIYAALEAADLFVAIGTSGAVYPAAGFVREARAKGVRCCELNLEPSENAAEFDDRRYGPASEIVPSWVEEMLGS